jgi:hypothetical protein
LHPEKVIIVDEAGDSSNQAKNGNLGGQNFLTTRHRKARDRCNTNDCNFTVLPFVATMGEPIMCAVIVAKKGPLTMEERIGFNLMAQLDEQDELYMGNIHKDIFCNGKENVFPYGPTTTYNGKQVQCYITSI